MNDKLMLLYIRLRQLVKDAEGHAAEDKARREVIDARNQADSLAYSVEKTINENRDRLPAVDVERVEKAIGVVRDAVKGDNLETIRAASAELQKASHSIAEQLYQKQAQGANHQREQRTRRKRHRPLHEACINAFVCQHADGVAAESEENALAVMQDRAMWAAVRPSTPGSPGR